MTTLVVTNDFPPRLGGIQSFVSQACGFLDNDVAVLTSTTRGQEEQEQRYDATLPYPVQRMSHTLLPLPKVKQQALEMAVTYGCDRVLFGAAAPLGLLARGLRTSGMERIVAISHGHEVWWSQLPVTRRAIARIVHDVDICTAISQWSQDSLAKVVAEADRHKIIRMAPPVDVGRFGYEPMPAGPPTVVTAGRLAPRKNHARLCEAFALVREKLPQAQLLIAGTGPLEKKLRSLAGPGVNFVGHIPEAQLPQFYVRGHVFISPVRQTRFDAEGFGMVFVEAASVGRPVIVGRSGGSPETVIDQKTGFLIEPDDVQVMADRMYELLTNPDQATAMGKAGRAHVQQFDAAFTRATLRAALDLA
ncbi:MAG: glycosyltransferase family 4 protein [Propionibacteriaceae bacterium]